MSFDEWLDTTKLRGYIDENSLEAAYDAGAQSRQAEIDCLKVQLYGANERAMMTLNHKNKMVEKKDREIDELKKRIDELKSFCTKGVESNMLSIEYNQALIDMYKILKGNQS